MKHKTHLLIGFVGIASIGIACADTYVEEGVTGVPFFGEGYDGTITGGDDPIYSSGTVAASLWSDVANDVHTGYPGWPGTSSWPSPMDANSDWDTATSISLAKVSNGGAGGGPYAADDTIYFGGFWPWAAAGGTLAITEASPVSSGGSDVSDVTFQIQVGESYGGAIYESGGEPVLTYTTSSGTFTATLTSSDKELNTFTNGTYQNGEYDVDETVVLQHHEYNWDLSNISGTITSFTITWSNVMHAQVYGCQVNQVAN